MRGWPWSAPLGSRVYVADSSQFFCSRGPRARSIAAYVSDVAYIRMMWFYFLLARRPHIDRTLSLPTQTDRARFDRFLSHHALPPKVRGKARPLCCCRARSYLRAW